MRFNLRLLAFGLPMVIAGFFWLLTLVSLVFWWSEYFLRFLGCQMGEFGTFGCFEAAWYAYAVDIVMNFWVFAYVLFASILFSYTTLLLMLLVLFVSWGTILLVIAAIRRIALLRRPY